MYFAACSYTLCGDGSCVRTDGPGYICKCNEGSANLLNMSGLACVKPCRVHPPLLKLYIIVVAEMKWTAFLNWKSWKKAIIHVILMSKLLFAGSLGADCYNLNIRPFGPQEPPPSLSDAPNSRKDGELN